MIGYVARMVLATCNKAKRLLFVNYILTIFHYRKHPRVVTCQMMMDATKVLSL